MLLLEPSKLATAAAFAAAVLFAVVGTIAWADHQRVADLEQQLADVAATVDSTAATTAGHATNIGDLATAVDDQQDLIDGHTELMSDVITNERALLRLFQDRQEPSRSLACVGC